MKKNFKNRQKELFELMSAQHDGLMDESALARLSELLEGDGDAQRYYLELGTLFQELEETYHGHYADTFMDAFPEPKAKLIPLFGWAAGIAASLAAVFLLFPGAGGSRHSELLVDVDSTVLMNDNCFNVHIVHAEGVEWGAENTVAILKGELKHGMLDLKSGTIDVVLDSGVRFGFVAPVKMDLTSLQQLSLYSGSLVVHVPGLSDGLSIRTPEAVLSANTAMALIECTEDGKTLLNVERGAINVFTENEKGHEIRKSIVGDETVEIIRKAANPILATRRVIEPRIDLSQPPVLENLQYVHYRFNGQGEIIKNHGTTPEADGYVAGTAEFPAPRRVPGRFGRALEFSGNGEGVLADLKAFGRDEPGSVAFWIKMDPETVPGPYENIFSWHMYSTPEKVWHIEDDQELACRIRINENQDEGVVGAVKIEFRNHWICGTTDLRDGRWHHVTAVFHRGYQGTMVRHYIDGELARSSARGNTWFPTERYPDIGGGSIAIGRIYWPERPAELAADAPCGFRGMIDELYVFNQAVLPSHASRLFLKNHPDQPADVSLIFDPQPLLAFLPLSLGK